MADEQFDEWMAFYGMDPWDGLRDDVNAALLASILANVNRDTKKRSKPFTLDDFMIDWLAVGEDGGGEQRTLPSPDELKAKVTGFLAALVPVKAPAAQAPVPKRRFGAENPGPTGQRPGEAQTSVPS